MKDFTLILPCYNESSHIEESFSKIKHILSQLNYEFEVLFVEDCSTDDTKAKLQRLLDNYEWTRGHFHPENKGRGQAVINGIKMAQGRVVGFIDFDLEVSSAYIPMLVGHIRNGDCDVATGLRKYTLSASPYVVLRHILSLGYRLVYKLVIGLPIKDPETGYKFFSREKVLPVLDRASSPGWIWDSEIMSFSYMLGLKIKEVPCLFIRQPEKKTSIRVFSYTIRQFKEIFQLRSRLKSQFPGGIPVTKETQ